MKQKYDEIQVVKALNQKHDCRVNSAHKKIEIIKDPHGKGDLGNKSKGKIDFLLNYCGYQRSFVSSFTSNLYK